MPLLAALNPGWPRAADPSNTPGMTRTFPSSTRVVSVAMAGRTTVPTMKKKCWKRTST